jgi:recombination protein RecT
VQAVYAEAKLTSGEVQTAVLTKDEVEGIRKRSRAGASGPWATDWSEMAKKTAIRRLSKLLPLSVEIAEAMDKDDDRLTERNITPVPRIAALPDMIAEPEAETVSVEGATDGDR